MNDRLWILTYIDAEAVIRNWLCQSYNHAVQVAIKELLGPVRECLDDEFEDKSDEWLIENWEQHAETFGESLYIQPTSLALHDNEIEGQGELVEDPLKMYILVKEDVLVGRPGDRKISCVPHGIRAVVSAHAALACFLEYRDNPHMQRWIAGRFSKVICRVGHEQFDAAKEFEDHVVITESYLGNAEVALAFCPRPAWPKAFRYYPLYK